MILKLRYFVGYLFLSLVLVSSNESMAAPAKEFILTDDMGHFIKISLSGSNLAAVSVSKEIVSEMLSSTSVLAAESGEFLYSTGKAKIQDSKVFRFVDGAWLESSLAPPPNPKIKYVDAIPDADGNLFVKLGGSASGINFVGKNEWVFISKKIGLTANYAKILPVKGRAGVMALETSGDLTLINVDHDTGRVEQKLLAQKVKDIVEVGSYQIALTNNGLAIVGTRGLRPVDLGDVDFDSLRILNPETPLDRNKLLRIVSGTQSAVQRTTPPGVKPKKSFEDLNPNSKPVDIFLGTISRVITDEIAMDEYEGKRVKYFGRDLETEKSLEVLSRVYGANPVLVGEAGVGKTAIAELLAQRSFYGEYSGSLRSLNALDQSIWVETSPDKISLLAQSDTDNSQAAAVRTFIESVQEVQKLVERPIVVFIDEVHMFSEAQLNALKPILESKRSPIRFVMATTNREYGLLVKRDAAVERRLPRVEVPEFSSEDTKKLLIETVVPYYEEAYRGLNGQAAIITEDAVDKVIERTREYLPNGSFPEGPIKLLMDSLTHEHNKANGESPTLDAARVSAFVKRELRLPIDPDAPDFDTKIEEVRETLKSIVIEQDLLVDSLVDNFRSVVDADQISKKHRVLLITGVTGSGKTFGVEQAAKLLVGESRHLVIDGTKYANANGNISILMNDLLGAPPGIMSSDQTSGVLPEFLAGRGRGFNMITINEADKMDPEAFKRLMEMFDRGELQAADGKVYKLGRSIISLTTNKGSDEIYPRKHVRGMSRSEILSRAKQYSVDQIKNFFLKPDPNNLYSDKVLPPEVVQRIDDAVVALPPSEEGVKKILENEIRSRAKSLEKHKGYKIEFTDTVVQLLVSKNYDPINGVRTPKRILHKLIDHSIAIVRKGQGLERGDTLIIDLVKDGRTSFSFTAKNKNVDGFARISAGELEMPAGVDPFEDATLRSLLLSLEDKFAEDVFGQKEMIARVAELVRNQRVTKQLQQPVTALLLGTTGTGKSELAKAIARKYFGSESRMKMFNMGEVKSEIDFNNIFSPPKGIVGSQKIGPFEEFVRANEKIGGVLLLDEIGNMGGMNPALKKELLMKFYSIFDEGTWASPITGEEYNLKNILIVMTSNEGQELFKETPSDDLRISTWEDINKQEVLHDLLTEKHGWPEALVGRLDLVTMAKPLIKEDRVFITKKFLAGFRKSVLENSPIHDVVGSEDFYNKMSNVFFSHTKGARLLKKVIEKGPLASLFTKARIALSPNQLDGAVVKLDLEDSYFGRFYTETPETEKRNVHFKLVVEKDGKILGSFVSDDLSGMASPKRLVTKESVRSTAIHEAGHALVNFPSLTGFKTVYVTVVGDGFYNGYARSKRLEFSENPTRESVIAHIAMILAGQLAQVQANVGKDAGWASDLEKARKFAERAVTDWGLVESVHELPVKDGKVIVDHKKVQQEISKYLQEATILAKATLKKNWPLVLEMTERLVAEGEIKGDKLDSLLDRVQIPEAQELKSLSVTKEAAPSAARTNGKSKSSNCQRILDKID